MADITVYSLDYDNCSDILFDSARKKEGDKLLHYLKHMASLSEIVEVYVGSNRQSQSWNKWGARFYRNGDCFKNFEVLCKSHGWHFNRLLLADLDNQAAAGSAMADSNLELKSWHVSYLTTVILELKIKLLTAQLEDIAAKHKGKTIDFYFIDDDRHNVIFEGLRKHFEQHPIPSNIRLILKRWNASYTHPMEEKLDCAEGLVPGQLMYQPEEGRPNSTCAML